MNNQIYNTYEMYCDAEHFGCLNYFMIRCKSVIWIMTLLMLELFSEIFNCFVLIQWDDEVYTLETSFVEI